MPVMSGAACLMNNGKLNSCYLAIRKTPSCMSATGVFHKTSPVVHLAPCLALFRESLTDGNEYEINKPK